MKRVCITVSSLAAIIVALLTFLIGYHNSEKPPRVSFVQQRFQANEEYLQVILDFFSSVGYEDIYINNDDGTMLADLTRMEIDNKEVLVSVKHLLNDEYMHIIKNGNTIYLLQWKSFRDIGCGIAHTINQATTPEIDFITELIPISEDGWFYYVSDYNTWRSTRGDSLP